MSADRGAGIQQQPLKDAYGAKSPRLSDGMQCTVGQIRLETRRRSYGIGLRFSCCKSVNCSIFAMLEVERGEPCKSRKSLHGFALFSFGVAEAVSSCGSEGGVPERRFWHEAGHTGH